MINLRPYQEETIQQLRQAFIKGARRIILCLPTGGGKTHIFTFMAAGHLKKANTKALIITDRIELMYQAGGAIERHDLKPFLIKAGSGKVDVKNNSFVGMVETISRRRKQLAGFCETITLVIADEAHKGNFQKLYNLFPNAVIIGATATPVATKNNRLSDIFDSMVVGVQVPLLIEGGYLSAPRHYAPVTDFKKFNTVAGEYNQAQVYNEFEKEKLRGGLITCFKKYGLGKTLVFCVNIKHTEMTCNDFINEGYNAKYLTSDDKKEKRTTVLNWFSNTDNAILVNCGILTTGYDEPSIKTIVLNRKTKSLPLYMQMIGRGSRVTPTKKEFIIIDMGNNIDDHGFWEDERDWFKHWNYEEKTEGVGVIKNCPSCECMIPAASVKCKFCGHVFDVKEKRVKISEVIDTLEVRTKKAKRMSPIPDHLRYAQRIDNIEDLFEAAKYGSRHDDKPYHWKWILRQAAMKGLVSEYAEIKGLSLDYVNKQIASLDNYKK